LTRIGIFEHLSCYNPNFTAHWKYVLETPLHASKKPWAKYSLKWWKAMITRHKMVMMVETTAMGNQIEKSNLMILWTKDGV
jgi:hypothetical protein